MSDLLEEADIDYTYQKRIELFKKILPFVVLATFVSIVIIGTKDWYYNREAKKQEDRSNLLAEALYDKSDKSLNKEILTSLTKQNDGISDLASFALLESSDKEKSLEILEKLMENGSNQISKNIAKLEYVGILLDLDKLKPEQISKMQSILVQIDKTQPLYRNAQVYSCLFNIKIENFVKAKEIAQKLLDEENLPESIRSQAESVLSYINEKESK